MVSRVSPGDPTAAGERSCPDPDLVPGSCSAATLPGGGTLVLIKGYEYADRRDYSKRWAATATYPDGRQVSVREWNAPAEKDAPATRPEPPLPASRLRSIAAAPIWAKVAADLPTPLDPKDRAPGPSSAALATVLGKLLPKPVTVRKTSPGPALPHPRVQRPHPRWAGDADEAAAQSRSAEVAGHCRAVGHAQ